MTRTSAIEKDANLNARAVPIATDSERMKNINLKTYSYTRTKRVTRPSTLLVEHDSSKNWRAINDIRSIDDARR